MATCSFPECPHPTKADGLCSAHYQQAHRQQRLKPTRTPRGQGTRVTVNMPVELLQRIEADAMRRDEKVPEWIRGAAEERLKGK